MSEFEGLGDYGVDRYGCSWVLKYSPSGSGVYMADGLIEKFGMGKSIHYADFSGSDGDAVQTNEWLEPIPPYIIGKPGLKVVTDFYEGEPILGGMYRTQNRFWLVVGYLEYVDGKRAYRFPRVYNYVCPFEGTVGPQPASGFGKLLLYGLLGVGAFWGVKKLMRR